MSDLVKSESESIGSAILRVVAQKDIDPERLEKFLDLQFKMEERQAKSAFAESLAGFQGDCPSIIKNKKVGFGSGEKAVNYSYSPLDEIVHIIRPVLKKYGLSFSFDCRRIDDKTNELVTILTHKQGHSESYSHFYFSCADGQGNMSQRIKSALTYAKRAALESALGLVTAGEDDDALRATDRPATEEQLTQVKELAELKKADVKKLLVFLEVASFDDLTDFGATKAIHALKQKSDIKVVKKESVKQETKKEFGPPVFTDDDFPEFKGKK